MEGATPSCGCKRRFAAVSPADAVKEGWAYVARINGNAEADHNPCSGYGCGPHFDPGNQKHEGGYVSQAGRARRIRSPTLRGNGPVPDGGLPHVLLRVSLPLYHWHR